MENKSYNFKFNFIILLLLILLSLSTLIYLKPNIPTANNDVNNSEIGQNLNDIKIELSEIKAKHNNETNKFDEISSTLSKIGETKEGFTNTEAPAVDKTALQISYHKLSNLLLHLFQIKEIIFNGGDYSNYLYEFNQFIEDEKIKSFLDNLNRYINNNISILNLLDELNKVDLNKDEKADNDGIHPVKGFIFNIIKIKTLGKENLYKTKIEAIKNHLIKRELKAALEIINQFDDSMKNEFTSIKEKIETLIEIEFILNDFYKYLGSNEFLQKYFKINS
ncbi:MAG: hypothetical protein ACK4OM_00285 [Alphaproteobacteria bacterium]